MSAYYNENDPGMAAWLRELIQYGVIAPGIVDERDIRDVVPAELVGYRQCHFFAGAGVWSYALRCAGWPDDLPVWTGSCPCQPFSEAGRRAGFADERHLWPSWFYLIEQCHPGVVLGEQVASKDGESWLDLVCADLEGLSYSVAPVDLPAAGVGAPHSRQRFWFVAHADGFRKGVYSQAVLSRECESRGGGLLGNSRQSRLAGWTGVGGDDGQELPAVERAGGATRGFWSGADWLWCRDGKYRPVEPGTFPLAHGAAARVGRIRGYGNAICAPAAQEVIESYMDILGIPRA